MITSAKRLLLVLPCILVLDVLLNAEVLIFDACGWLVYYSLVSCVRCRSCTLVTLAVHIVSETTQAAANHIAVGSHSTNIVRDAI